MIKKILFRNPTLYEGKKGKAFKWFVSYHVLDQETKKLKRIRVYGRLNSLPVHERYAEASKMMKAITGQLASTYKGKQIIEVVTLVEHIQDFLKRKQINRRKTWLTYCSFGNRFFQWLMQNGYVKITADCFTTRHAFEFLDHMLMTGICAGTYNNYRRMMKTFFNDIISRGYIKKNPFNPTKKLQHTEAMHRAFTPMEQKTLKNYLSKNTPWLYLFVCFEYYCFIRPAELCRLKISHLDLENMKIYVPGEISKNKQSTWVVIPDAFIDIITSYDLDEYPKDWQLFSRNLLPGTTIIHPNRASEMHRSILKHLHITDGHPTLYAWKHTGAIRAVQSGVNIKDLQLHLRHSSLDMVNKYLRGLGMEASGDLRDKFPVM
jgi:integrase